MSATSTGDQQAGHGLVTSDILKTGGWTYPFPKMSSSGLWLCWQRDPGVHGPSQGHIDKSTTKPRTLPRLWSFSRTTLRAEICAGAEIPG